MKVITKPPSGFEGRVKDGLENFCGLLDFIPAHRPVHHNETEDALARAGTISSAAFLSKPCSAFSGERLLSSGTLIEVALAAHSAAGRGAAEEVMIFDDSTGAVIDLNIRGPKAKLIAQLYEQSIATAAPNENTAPQAGGANDAPRATRRRGRPKLGVISREVTLMPRHWEWLASQPGGISVMLRRLVDKACQAAGHEHSASLRCDLAYRFISAVGKSQPNFNETASALRSGNRERFTQELSFWPVDMAAYAFRLAFGSEASAMSNAQIPE